MTGKPTLFQVTFRMTTTFLFLLPDWRDGALILEQFPTLER